MKLPDFLKYMRAVMIEEVPAPPPPPMMLGFRSDQEPETAMLPNYYRYRVDVTYGAIKVGHASHLPFIKQEVAANISRALYGSIYEELVELRRDLRGLHYRYPEAVPPYDRLSAIIDTLYKGFHLHEPDPIRTTDRTGSTDGGPGRGALGSPFQP